MHSKHLPIVALAALLASACGQPPSRELQVRAMPHPKTSNPLDLSIGSNSAGFGAIRFGLATESKRGEIKGLLAQRWETSADFKTWRFIFRKTIRFETGEEVKPADFVESWRWLALHSRDRAVHTELLKHIVGFKTLTPEGPWQGLQSDAHSVTLRFDKPFPRLLAHLGKPQYAVTHPRCRDALGKEWRCLKRAVSSGPYRIRDWTDREFILEKRRDFPASFSHPSAPNIIRISGNRETLSSPDVILSSSKAPPENQESYRFRGGMNSMSSYVICVSWKHPESPCYDPRTRRDLRDLYFNFLKGKPQEFYRASFPTAIPGVAEGVIRPADKIVNRSLQGREFKVEEMGSALEPHPPIEEAFSRAAEAVGATLREIPQDFNRIVEELDPDLPEHKYDFIFIGYSFNLNDPESSIRDMFLPSSGPRYPDPTGEIAREIRRPAVNFGRINSLIWRDAVIWPFGQTTPGIWHRSNLDLSRFNHENAADSLQWIGLN